MNLGQVPGRDERLGALPCLWNRPSVPPALSRLVVADAPPEAAGDGPATIVGYDLVPESTAVPEDVSGPVAVGAVVPYDVVRRVSSTQKRSGDDGDASTGNRRIRCVELPLTLLSDSSRAPC